MFSNFGVNYAYVIEETPLEFSFKPFIRDFLLYLNKAVPFV